MLRLHSCNDISWKEIRTSFVFACAYDTFYKYLLWWFLSSNWSFEKVSDFKGIVFISLISKTTIGQQITYVWWLICAMSHERVFQAKWRKVKNTTNGDFVMFSFFGLMSFRSALAKLLLFSRSFVSSFGGECKCKRSTHDIVTVCLFQFFLPFAPSRQTRENRINRRRKHNTYTVSCFRHKPVMFSRFHVGGAKGRKHDKVTICRVYDLSP